MGIPNLLLTTENCNWYIATRLVKAIRPYHDRRGHVHDYGNYISNGENPKDGCWKNFLTKHAFNYAKERTNPENKKPYETIESDRLFNNPLSNQPMAFNLFCPLRKMLNKLTDAKYFSNAYLRFVLHWYTMYYKCCPKDKILFRGQTGDCIFTKKPIKSTKTHFF